MKMLIYVFLMVFVYFLSGCGSNTESDAVNVEVEYFVTVNDSNGGIPVNNTVVHVEMGKWDDTLDDLKPNSIIRADPHTASGTAIARANYTLHDGETIQAAASLNILTPLSTPGVDTTIQDISYADAKSTAGTSSSVKMMMEVYLVIP